MINVAFVGCGRISKKHYEAVSTNKNLKLVAVCDIVEKRAKDMAEQAKVPYYLDYNEMMHKENIHVVSVMTEAGYHAKIVIDLAKFGKVVIVEKPMALKLSDADEMIKACKNGKTDLVVVKQNRYNQTVMKLKDAVERGRFGKMILGTVRLRWNRSQTYFDMDDWRGTWSLDGGVFASQASHHVDLLQWIMGPVKSVYAKTTRRLLDIEVEDTGIVMLEFYDGSLGLIEATNAAQPKNIEGSLSVLGQGGTVVIGGVAVNKLETWEFWEKEEDDEKMFDFSENPSNVYGFGHVRLYNEIVERVKHDRGNLLSGEEGRKSLELINAIYESAETGKEVRIKFQPEHVRLGK